MFRKGLSPILLVTLIFSAPSYQSASAADFDLLSVSARLRVGEKRVLGNVQPVSFREYDLMVALRLPANVQIPSGPKLDTRLLLSAGVMQGAGKNSVVASAIPVFAMTTQDERFVVDTGIGLALMTRYRFDQQDFGGPLQFALTAGCSVPIYGRFGVGYRFMHYSDAGLYSPSTTGADFHMVELIYRY